MLRIVAFVLVAGCTSFVHGPPKERTGVVVIDCTDNYVFPSIDATMWTVTLSATIYWAKAGTFDDTSGLGGLFLPLGIATSIVLPIVAAHGFERVHACRETKQSDARWRVVEEQRASRERIREHAWILTKEAALAARAGNCDAVREASAKVRAEDADFHATVFVRDVAIARCL